MAYQYNDAQFRNLPYQQQIARNLIDSLGVDGAIDICSRNGWEGTLLVILRDKRNFPDA